ncbi:MAG: polymerase sigma factor, sigma-70 family [Acidobacteria bacterium]|nr:polymerase sigma factor, sigma-70 family [Acidobacteriota bacterium]
MTTGADAAAPAGPEQLLLQQLETVERTIRFACRRGELRDADAEDFASYVKLKLIDDDYAVIRKHERQSSFAAFLSVVVQRLLLDYRIAQWGKWHASAQAKRMGEPAITIEAILHRDGRTVDEALPVLRRRWPDLTRPAVENIASNLPPRTLRPRRVDADMAAFEVGATAASVQEAAFASDRRKLSRRVADIIRAAIDRFEEHDRLLFRLRFEGGMSIADISRSLGIEQKPLYRRFQRGLVSLRQRLEEMGIGAEQVNEMLSSQDTDLDFGLGRPASDTSSPTEGS